MLGSFARRSLTRFSPGITAPSISFLAVWKYMYRPTSTHRCERVLLSSPSDALESEKTESHLPAPAYSWYRVVNSVGSSRLDVATAAVPLHEQSRSRNEFCIRQLTSEQQNHHGQSKKLSGHALRANLHKALARPPSPKFNSGTALDIFISSGP